MSLPVEIWLPAAMLALGVVTWGALQLYRKFGPGAVEEKAAREALVATFVHFAAEGLAKVAPATTTKLDDYLAQALAVVDAKLREAGARPLTPQERERAVALTGRVLPGPQP